MSFRLISFLIIVISGLFSCKKEKDVKDPQINISSPWEGQSFNVYDTVSISFSVTDDNRLVSVSAAIVNEQFIPVLPEVSFSPSGTTFSQTFLYEIDDVRLPSGSYYVRIKASNGTNSENAYSLINISEAPKIKKGIFAFQRGVNDFTVFRIDDNNVTSTFINATGDFSAALIDSYWQAVYTLGVTTSGLKAFDANTSTLKWHKQPNNGTSPTFSSLMHNGKYVYAGYRDGFIKAYDQNGNIKFSASVPAPFYPKEIFEYQQFLFLQTKELNGPAKKIVLLDKDSGAGMQEVSTSSDVLEFLPKDVNNIYVLGNSNLQGNLEIYDINSNGSWSPHTLPAGKITCAASVDANTILVGMDNNTLFKYYYPTNSLLTFASGFYPSSLAYDQINNQVIVGTIGEMKIINYSNPTLVNTVSISSDTINQIGILYNK